uniref:Uncharacterized protein n=1 Tax=Tetranychus urticae TaxID=32264 RepID=T1KJC4_TETUR
MAPFNFLNQIDTWCWQAYLANSQTKSLRLFENTYASCNGCDGDLSCLDTCKVLTFKAITPEQMELKFKLFTNENHDNPIDFTYNFSMDQITASPIAKEFNAENNNLSYHVEKFENLFMLQKLQNGILTSQPHKYSVFYVDWSKSTPDLNYARALNNVAVVCSALATFIKIVGHSLGSHIAEIAATPWSTKTRFTGGVFVQYLRPSRNSSTHTSEGSPRRTQDRTDGRSPARTPDNSPGLRITRLNGRPHELRITRLNGRQPGIFMAQSLKSILYQTKHWTGLWSGNSTVHF